MPGNQTPPMVKRKDGIIPESYIRLYVSLARGLMHGYQNKYTAAGRFS
jgi:hypothetical protein